MNMSNAFNLGIKLAQTDYIMMTGVDFLFSPNFFEVLQSQMKENRIVQCLLVICHRAVLTWIGSR